MQYNFLVRFVIIMLLVQTPEPVRWFAHGKKFSRVAVLPWLVLASGNSY